MTPAPVFQALVSYRTAAVMRAAIELDCFSAISEGRREAAAISAARGGTERSIRILLDAVAASSPGLLRKSGRRYGLTPLSRRYLVRTSSHYLGGLMPLYGHRRLWDSFYSLPDAVRAGRSVMESNAHTPGEPFWTDFARATAREAAIKARKMLRLLGKLPRPCDILDVACGSGMYGATFARGIPGARLTLFDQAYVLETTRKLVDVAARYVEGDLFGSSFEGPYDLVIASHVFHHFDRTACASLVKKMAEALKPGGRLVVQDFIPDEGRRRRLQPIMFAVTMLVWTEAGDAYSAGDYRKWFADAGLGRVEHHRFDDPGDVIVARKKG